MLCHALGFAATPALADWAGFSRYGEVAEIAIEAGEIRVNLRLAASAVPKDLPAVDPASPPDWLVAITPIISGSNGKALAGKLLFLEKVGADGAQEAYYEAKWRYPIVEALDALRIVPPKDASVSVGLVVLHRGVPVSDLVPLQKPLNLALDWADPWRSRFDEPDFVRRHAEPRSYVYVEPYEVRHELLLRLKDLKPWLDLGLKDPLFIDDGEREALKRKLGDFLVQRNPLLIDGARAVAQIDRVEFVRFSRAGILPVTEAGRLDADTVLVGVVLAYLTETPARTVALRWDLFAQDGGTRQLSLMRGKETFDGYMSPKQPEFEWSQDESLAPAPGLEDAVEEHPAHILPTPAGEFGEPLVFRAGLLLSVILALIFALFASSLLRHRHISVAIGLLLILSAGFALQPRQVVLAGGANPGNAGLDEAQAKVLLQSLLHNAYRAFPLRDEEKAYDRLAKSLDGDLLDDIYLQQRLAILRHDQGLGGEGKVDRIDVLEAHVHPAELSPNSWQVDSRWMAHGTVSHWGHSHERHNLYQAKLTLRPVDGGQWKIVGLEFIGGQRLDAGPSS